MCDDMQFFFFLNYPDVGKAGLGQQLFQFFGSVHRHSLYPLRPRLSEFGVARFQTDEKAAPFRITRKTSASALLTEDQK